MMNPVRIAIIDYTNWRGERAVRRIVPQMILFANNEWHPETQWLLEAVDADTGEARTFALKNIHSWHAWGETGTVVTRTPSSPGGLQL